MVSFTLTCKVRRTSVRAQTASPMKKFEYGCQFLKLEDADQEQIRRLIAQAG